MFFCTNGQMFPIHTIHILKAIVPAVNLAYLGPRFEWAIDKEDMVDSLALDNNKNHNNNSNNNDNNNIKTTKDTDESPPTEWMSMSTQEIAQVDTQFPIDDPGWWQLWKRNEELEKEMIELMKN